MAQQNPEGVTDYSRGCNPRVSQDGSKTPKG